MSNLEQTETVDNIFIDKSKAMITERPSSFAAEDIIKDIPKVDKRPKFELPVSKVASNVIDEATVIAADSAVSTDPKVLAEKLKTLEQALAALHSAKGTGGVRVVSVTAPKELDFSKLSEDSVYDLDVAIQAINHQVPDLTKVTLRDSHYVPRWVSLHPARLGPMKAAGFTYVETEDIEEVALDLQPNENGQYVYIDVVLMKVSKAKYFGALRANFLRSKAATDPTALHRFMKDQTAKSLGDMADPQGVTHRKDAQKYMRENKLEVYI